MTRPARIAWVIITVSLMGWIGALFLPESPWTTIFRHACEGAFVGGICDAFAIWKVYGKVEVHFQRLTAEVSETVVDDLVRPEQIVENLVAKLHEPEFAERYTKVPFRIPTSQMWSTSASFWLRAAARAMSRIS